MPLPIIKQGLGVWGDWVREWCETRDYVLHTPSEIMDETMDKLEDDFEQRPDDYLEYILDSWGKKGLFDYLDDTLGGMGTHNSTIDFFKNRRMR